MECYKLLSQINITLLDDIEPFNRVYFLAQVLKKKDRFIHLG